MIEVESYIIELAEKARLPRSLEELCDYILEHADCIAVRE
jgi:hypothetical protein